jgi:ubiquinone/menaquinone biosynthesis C-methylase UbiE
MQITIGAWRITVERTAPTDAELAAMYDRVAWYWHEKMRLLGYTQAYDGLFARLRDDGLLRGLGGGGRVLDCGVGTGAFGLALAKSVAAPLRIDGVDISPAMLGRADYNLERRSVEYRLHRCEVRRLPFDDDTFDAVLGAHLLEDLPDPLAGLSEMSHVLRSGGLLVVVVTRHDIAGALQRLRWRYDGVDQDQLVRWMREAGLHDVRVYTFATGGFLPRLTSVAYVGFKNEGATTGRSQKNCLSR